MKKLQLMLILFQILFSYSQSAVVQIDNGEPAGNIYKDSWAYFEESIVLFPEGPCTVDSIVLYLSGDVPSTDTLWIVGFPTSGNLWPTQYIWHFNTLIDPIIYNYDGVPGWKSFDIKSSNLRSEGLDKIVIQHRLKPGGPWFTYDKNGRNHANDSWITDPFTPNPNFLNIIGTIYYYPPGDFMARLNVRYDFPDGNTSLKAPAPIFKNVSQQCGISGHGESAVVDWNNDGWDDIDVAGNFFENNGDGTFRNINSILEIQRGNTTWGDINNDGLLDVFVALNWENNKVYLNNGNNQYSDITPKTTILNNYPTMTPLWLDYNNDGLLDLFIANNRTSDAQGNETYYPDQLWKNNGDSSFTNVRSESGIANGEPAENFDCYGAEANDYNNDNFTDIFVANYRLAKDNQFKNNGNGTFIEVGSQTGLEGVTTSAPGYFGHGMGCDWGDFNNDAYIDLCVGNLAHTDSRGQYSNPSLIFKNNGHPDYNFTEVHRDMGLKFYEGNAGTIWLDLDLDGYLDLWHGLYNGGVSHLYMNEGPPDFKLREITWVSGTVVNDAWSASRIDYDNDGDQDILIFGSLFRNDMPRNGKWLEILLSGSPENNVNMDAYGSRLTVFAGGRKFYRQLSGSAGGSRCMQNSNYIHFGLGNVDKIDSLVIVYSNGSVNSIKNLKTNAKYHIAYMDNNENPFQIGLATPALEYPHLYETKLPIDLILKWHISTGANSYRLEISDDIYFSTERTKIYNTSSTLLEMTELENNKTYYWKVKCLNDKDTSNFSSVWNFTTGYALPPKPDLLLPLNSAVKVSALTLLTWKQVKYNCEYCSKNKYELQLSDSISFEDSGLLSYKDIIDSTYKLTDTLLANHLYYWRVRGLNENNPGEWSEVRSFTTMILPDKINLLLPGSEAVEVETKPRFSWTADENATQYHLQTSKDMDFGELFFEMDNIKSNNYKNLTLKYTNGTEFFWRVRGLNDGGAGEWSDIYSFKVTGSPPSVPEMFESMIEMNVFPNPVQDFARISLSIPDNLVLGINENSLDVKLSVYDLIGNEQIVVYEGSYTKENGNFVFNTSKLNSGVFYCRLKAGFFSKIIKFQVIK